MTGGGMAGYLYNLNDMEKAVKSEVQDDARKSAAVDVVKAMQDRDKEFRDTVVDYVDKVDQQFNGAVITEADAKGLLGPYDEAVKAYQDDMTSSRFALREQISREEWAAIFPTD